MYNKIATISLLAAFLVLLILYIGERRVNATEVILEPYKYLQYDKINVYTYEDECNCDCDY